MINLQLPSFPFSLQEKNGKVFIFDCIRKKYVTLTPEERVRQHIVRFLSEYRGYPISLMSIEMPFKVARMKKRSDIIVFNNELQPLMLVECKAPEITLNDKVFDQASVYNLQIKAPYILISNGVMHYCLEFDGATQKYQFLFDIPLYKELAQRQR